MPSAPSSLSPLIASSGICASRSIRAPSISVSQKSRSLARNSSPRRTSSTAGVGCGWMRSSRKRPRNSSLAKLGLRQSCSRAASATWRASRSETLADGWSGHQELTSPRGREFCAGGPVGRWTALLVRVTRSARVAPREVAGDGRAAGHSTPSGTYPPASVRGRSPPSAVRGVSHTALVVRTAASPPRGTAATPPQTGGSGGARPHTVKIRHDGRGDAGAKGDAARSGNRVPERAASGPAPGGRRPGPVGDTAQGMAVAVHRSGPGRAEVTAPGR